MKLKQELINGKIIFDNKNKKFMSKKEMIKFAKDFWKQGLREDEKKEIENAIKENCKVWNENFNKEYLKMKINYLFEQFNETLYKDYKTYKKLTPFDVWDGSDIETWELVEIPEQIFGIWIDDDGEEKMKRLKEMIKLNNKRLKNEI